MGLFTNPLGHAGYPPGASAPATVVNSTVRAATLAEATAGTLTDVYISPATISAAGSASFASPPVLGFGSTTPRPVNATVISTTASSAFTLGDASNIVFNTATGTKIGTSTTQKFAFFNATPIVQPVAATDIKVALVNLGLLASGASPLDLGSAAFGSGTITLVDGANIVVGSGSGTKFGTATTQKMGWYNATPVIRQTQGAITNSVTAGGTTGTIADFTDLSTYATDAATIRNDIYQLALGLQGCIAALRTYGLLG